MPRSPAARTLLVGVALALLAGCRSRQTTVCPTPAESGLNTRDLIDPPAQAEAEQMSDMVQFAELAAREGDRIRAERRRTAPPGRPPRNVLCLSGGGSFGAFSAGVLCGWTERGDRPCFDVVTGISTGGLIAPLAFLGSRYDGQMKRLYTTIQNEDIFRKQYVRGLLGGESFTDTSPLRRTIGEVLTPEIFAELADAHRAGRRLYIGTTEEEGKRFVIWDLGAMACRNGPGDRDLMIDVLVGSASVPGFFPSSKIDVTVDGVCHTERHVDGGVSQGLFFRPPFVPPELRTPETLNLVDTNVWAVLAGKVYADTEVIKPSALNQAGKAVSTIIYAQTRGDLQRLWTMCLLSGMNYHCTAIPQDYPAPLSSGEFSPAVMGPLFEEGRVVARSGNTWRTTPPGVDRSQGETPQERWGRNLTFQQRGPQLPIPGPRKQSVSPRYPTSDRLPIPAVPAVER